MTLKRTTTAAALTISMVGGAGIGVDQAAAAGGCGPGGNGKWTSYESSHSTRTNLANECDWMRVKSKYAQPGVGYVWGQYSYDYTVGERHSDWSVKNYPQWTPVLSAEGSDWIK